jgi:hypothetical protein
MNKNIFAAFLLDEPKPFVSLNHLTTLCISCLLFVGLAPELVTALVSESDAVQSLVKRATCNVLQKLPKLRARSRVS